MTDDLLKQLDQLFDNKLSAMRTESNSELGAIEKHMDEGFTTLSAQIDTVAAHLGTAIESLCKVEKTQQDHSELLTRIDRRLEKHGVRIETLEAKTAHLSVPRRK